MKVKCNYCGFEYDAKEGVCPNCGTTVEENSNLNKHSEAKPTVSPAKPVTHERPTMVIPDNVTKYAANTDAPAATNGQQIVISSSNNDVKKDKKLSIFLIICFGLSFLLAVIALICPGVSVTDGTYTATLSVFDYLAGSNSTCINPSYFSVNINITVFYGYVLAAVYLITSTFGLSNKKVLNYIHIVIAGLTFAQAIVYISDVYNVAYLFEKQNTNIYFFGLLLFLISAIINLIGALVNTFFNIKNEF